jgi:replication factor C subunit 3/5
MEKGLALQDLITGAYDFLQTVELPKQSRIYLLDHLGSTEYVFRLALYFAAYKLRKVC